MPVKTILVALALQGDSKRVAARAIQLANQHKAQLVCLHVIEDLPYDSSLPASIDAALLGQLIKEESAGQLQCLLGSADKPAIVHVKTGSPHSLIENLARECHADLIVIGPGLPKTFREKVFGSTADRIVRGAPCPVLVVREDAEAPYSHIVVGVDLSAHAQAAALWASQLSPMASRDFLHAFEIPLAFEQAMLKAGTSQAEIDRYRLAIAKTARQQILKMLGENGRLPKTTRLRIVRGDASAMLIRASHRKKTDLVALGTQGANAVAQHILGSVARTVLINARCDVLVVPSTAIRNDSLSLPMR